MKCQKEKFSLREGEHYLNCATKAPLLKSAEAACIAALTRERNPMDITAETFFEELPIVRGYFAQLINVDASQVAIVPSVSYGFSSILKNTKAKPNGHAITIKDEFPSGYFALENWCKQNANELVIVAPNTGERLGRSWNENILESINDQTSVVLMSTVHWMNGIKFDLEKIGKKCKEVGAKFMVDGTQSIGALEMDIKKFHIDALVCAAYKWLFGPYSMGLTYLSEDYNNGIPIEESWMNRKNSNQFSQLANYENEYRTGATRYNVGETSNHILMPILKASLQQIIEWDPKNIQAYCAELIKPLLEYLKTLEVPLEEESFFCNHIFALQLPNEINLEKFKESLAKHKIHISFRAKNLRVSVNVFNDKKDIDKLIEVISRTLAVTNDRGVDLSV